VGGWVGVGVQIKIFYLIFFTYFSTVDQPAWRVIESSPEYGWGGVRNLCLLSGWRKG